MTDLKIDLLKGASEAIESIIKAIQTFTESISVSIKSGYETASYIKAKKTEERLHQIIILSKHLLTAQMAAVHGKPGKNATGFIPAIEEFIKSDGKDEKSWKEAQGFANRISEEIQLIWDEIVAESGDFVLEDSYTELINALKLRKKAIEDFNNIDTNCVDLEELEYFHLRYGELYNSMISAINAVITYTRKFKSQHNA